MKIRNVRSGAILGRPIFSSDGSVLLYDGIQLTDAYIDRIKRLGINRIYVRDRLVDDLELKNVISDETKQRLLNMIHRAYTVAHGGPLSRVFQKEVLRLAGVMVAEMQEADLKMMDFDSVYRTNDYIFTHSLNVSMMSVAIGILYGLQAEQLQELCLTGIMHDIGKMRIPTHVLDKPGKLTPDEWKLLQQHPQFGYDTLKITGVMPDSTLWGILEHHERWDGIGYPNQTSGSAISLFGRIVAVADVFDALTANRTYKEAHLPGEALEYLLCNGQQHFDIDLVRLFTTHISVYPIGTVVRLNTGEEGVVVRVSPHYHHRPSVRITRYSSGTMPCKPYEIDLTNRHHLSVFITDVV